METISRAQLKQENDSRTKMSSHIRNENYAILCNSNEGRRINNKRAARRTWKYAGGQ
jgi:hypothetical protein